MKRYLVAIFCFFLLFMGCGGNKTGNADDALDADSAEQVADTTTTDTAEDPLANLPMPKAADELFDDFIFNFSASKKLQWERIMFPLKKVNGDKVTGFGSGDGVFDGLQVEHFTDNDDVGVLTERSAQCVAVAFGIVMELALGDLAFERRLNDFDRVFHGNDVVFAVVITDVDQ